MPVQQHPIPQNVTSYQFRLVGDMTLRQFIQVAAGVVIAVVIYASPLPVIFKWPLIAFFAGLGAAIAFLPVQGRPLDQWIVAFVRSIYQPTIYTWRKPQPTMPPTPETNSSTTMATTTPSATSDAPPAIPSAVEEPMLNNQQSVQQSPTDLNQNKDSSVVSNNQLPAPAPLIGGESPQMSQTQQNTISIPEQQPLEINQASQQPQTVISTEAEPSGETPTPTQSPPTQQQPGSQTTFAPELPIPQPPTTPNTLTGMTLTHDGNILEGAIIEILQGGQTLRATRSNKLGQFLFAKPLDNGTFTLTAEKPDHTFPSFNLELKGEILPPIKLQAFT